MLTEMTNQLLNKGAALLLSEEAWQGKYSALEEKLTQDLAEKHQTWEMQKKMNQMEEEIHQRDTEILDLISAKRRRVSYRSLQRPQTSRAAKIMNSSRVREPSRQNTTLWRTSLQKTWLRKNRAGRREKNRWR